MTGYAQPTEQLAAEIFTQDIRGSVEFYRRLGFQVLFDHGDFVGLAWEENQLFLAEPGALGDPSRADLPAPPALPIANVRVLVPNVDEVWQRAHEAGARVVVAIGDRHYGLRDFTIVDPNGFGIRFASRRPGR